MHSIKHASNFFLFTLFLSLTLLVCADAHAKQAKVFVLCYHSFHGNKRFAGDVSMADLRTHMESLKTNGFGFVSLSDVINGKVKGSRNILIVIDDGNESVYRAYNEIFKPRRIKPVLAIYPNIIGKKSYAMTWDQLKELSEAGCEISSHGYYHLHLDQKLYERDKKAFIKEIDGSKELLEIKLGVKVISMAYPNGIHSDITKTILKDAGYRCAFTIKWGTMLSPLADNRDPFELPRYMIYQDNWGMIVNSVMKASQDQD